MKIENHLLVLEPGDPYEFRVDLTPDWASRAIIVPQLLLTHYAVSESLNGTVATQKHRKFFATLSADEFDEPTERGPVLRVVQMLPFNRRGSHAGASRWTDKSGRVWDGVSGCSTGLEIANWGPLKMNPGGKLVTVDAEVPWPIEQAVQARHKIKACGWKWWAEYSEAETDFVVQLGLLLRKYYPLEDVLGHDDVATPVGRKIDPGPAFPMESCRRDIFPERYNDPVPALGTPVG